MNKYFAFIFFILPFCSSAQNDGHIISSYIDSTEFKIVMRTEKENDSRYVALDNMTIKVKGDTTLVYYIRYGDMMISSLTIPFPIIESLVVFEDKVHSLACTSSDCVETLLFDDGINQIRIPIDILNEELLSNLMLELEN